MKRHASLGEGNMNAALLNNNFLEFMPGLKRQDIEELNLEMERWECSVCAFQNLVTKPICSMCSTQKEHRLIEVYSDTIPAYDAEKSGWNFSQRASKSLQRQTSKSYQRLSSYFQRILLPEDLNPRQRSARIRRQWTRQLDANDRVVWVRHFLDTEEFPDSYLIQTGPVEQSGGDCSVTVIIHDMATQNSTSSGDSLTNDAFKTIAWIPIEKGDAQVTILGTRLASSTWSALLPISRLPFSLKYAWFLNQLTDLMVPYGELHVQTKVLREKVFEEGLENLMIIKPEGLCAIIRYEFLNESGLDAGAIQREWYTLVAQALMDENSGLFIISNREDNSYFINPNSAHDIKLNVRLSHCEIFRAAGRFMGRALLDGQVLPLHLSPVLFKALLGIPMTLDDVESLDATIYKSLQYLVQNNNVEDLCLTFSITQPYGDGIIEVDLIPGGSDVAVIDANKHEYIELMVRFLLFGRVENQLLAMMQGLYDVIPVELLTAFDHKELELILCGLDEIDVNDWEDNTVTSSNLDNNEVLQWFWEVLADLSDEDKAKLLQFATGSSRVPVQGFKGLTSYDGKICYFTLKGVPYIQGHYPVAHACYNRIDLPLYPSKEDLEEAMRMLLLSDPTGMYEFMPGIKRGDVEELLTDAERWECNICSFQTLVQKQACMLCGTPKATRLVEVSPEQIMPRKSRRSSIQRASSISYRTRSRSILPRHSVRRLSILLQKALAPEDLNARQKSARSRKQWTRQIDSNGLVSWKRHFIDSEDFSLSFIIQLNPSKEECYANNESEALDECIVITLRGSIVRGMEESQDGGRMTESDTPTPPFLLMNESKSTKAIALLDLETTDPNKSVLGLAISKSFWKSLLPLSKLTFNIKYAWFLHQASDLVVPYEELYIKTKVTRDRVFEEALENLVHMKGRALCAILRFQFVGESGLDA
ncbi:HECT E3 ubiquitin ligase, partial [Thraustotheca clavata]